mgnify:CR=1 FL=1
MTTEIHSMVFSESMKLADLVDANFKLLNVLSRLGVSLGFGENTIREMCRKHGIDLNSFLLICSIYTYDNYIPSADLLAGADPGTIVDYLHNSHAFYLNKEFIALEAELHSRSYFLLSAYNEQFHEYPRAIQLTLLDQHM